MSLEPAEISQAGVAVLSMATAATWQYYLAYPIGIAGAICVGHLAGKIVKYWLRAKKGTPRHLRILTADGRGRSWTVRNSSGRARCADSGGWILDAPPHWLKQGVRLWVDLGATPVEEVEVDVGENGHASTIRLSKRADDLPGNIAGAVGEQHGSLE